MIGLRKHKSLFVDKLLNLVTRINENPIIILGNQKSGTTAIAALLAAATGSTVTNDLRCIYEPNQTRIHSKILSFADLVRKNKKDFSNDIIKEPCLTLLFDELKAYFKLPRFIFIIRDPRDNMRSILNRLNLPGNLENERLHPSYIHLSPEWKLVIDGTWLGLSGTNYIEWLSERWKLMAQIYLNNSNKIELIRYEDFLTDKEQSIKNLACRIGLNPILDISDKVDIQYQPRGKQNVSWSDFFENKNLMRIEKRCSNLMKSFGYHASVL